MCPAGTIGSLFECAIGFINSYLVPLIFAIAFIVFLWGIAQYFVMGGANQESRDKGKSLMIWGLIGFFLMVSVWGLVNILVHTFGFDAGQRPCLPTFGGPCQY